MFIESLVVDGFKSYANRTEISGWDERFNAITGLNGSGKSNILDAICFVLGITNLSQVRAGNLQELVYKQGQAGVTKASVTIIFNNSDQKTSPVGYESSPQITVTRQVVIGGRNKYLINGSNAQTSQVQNLFHSVQLNVNNPHFLIMQGRITKVLNMKPAEILGMIEEAAGTRMYENKKQVALKTMQKKQTKVQEINKILAEEITPTLEKLRKEKATYLQWAANNTEIERLERYCTAFAYTQAEELLVKASKDVEKMNNQSDEIEMKMSSLQKELEIAEQEYKVCLEKKEQEMQSGKYQDLQSKEEELGKMVVKVRTKMKNVSASLQKEKEKHLSLDQQLQEIVGSISQSERELEEQKQSSAGIMKDAADKEKKLEEVQDAIKCLSAGVIRQGKEKSTNTIAEELSEKQQELQQLKTQVKQHEMQKLHGEKNLIRMERELKSMGQQQSDLTRERSQLKSSIAQTQQQLDQLGSYSYEKEQHLKQERSHLTNEIHELSQQLQQLNARLPGRLRFKYDERQSKLNEHQVKGVLANLVSIRGQDYQEKSTVATALEITAGGKLYQIVVDTESTARRLLQKGGLVNRVTIIPLDKISGRRIAANKIALAKQLVGDNQRVWTALECMTCEDEKLEAALIYAFGGSFICSNAGTARDITFHPQIKTRCVTLEGDVFDPSGTLQGGSSATNRNEEAILLRLERIAHLAEDLKHKQQRLDHVQHLLQTMKHDSEQFGRLSESLSLQEQELRLLDERFQESNFGQLESEISNLNRGLSESNVFLGTAASKLAELSKVVSDLSLKQTELRAGRQEQMALLENQLKKAKEEKCSAVSKHSKLKSQLAQSTIALEEMTKEKRLIESALATTTEDIRKLDEEERELEEKCVALNKKLVDVTDSISAIRKELSHCDESLRQCANRQSEAESAIASLALTQKELANKFARMQKKVTQQQTRVNTFLKQFSWIADQKQYFGQQHTEYDFQHQDQTAQQTRLDNLKQMQGSLGKKINRKVMGMIEKAESEYEGLMKKREIIENDKSKITRVISELDAKKQEALHSTWVKVNKDFGSIFSTLLPGATAKLEQFDEVEDKKKKKKGPVSSDEDDLDDEQEKENFGKKIKPIEGLEVKVSFGGIWKESLTELSGGQRSLLALSLILSLLLFKPAPMYILDEVDAALDLSHTQNIGQMIRTHFQHSQFIVVSLKEGMFNNANVVFRTKFQDGVSQVTKTNHTQKKKKSRQ